MIALQKALGSRIAQRRRSAMLTQAQLAERIDVTTETISRIERGRTMPSLITLQEIAAALGCELLELLSDDKAAARRDRAALDRLLASVAHREPDDIHLVADIAMRIFQRYAKEQQRVTSLSARGTERARRR